MDDTVGTPAVHRAPRPGATTPRAPGAPIRADVWVVTLPTPVDATVCSAEELWKAAHMRSRSAGDRYLGSRVVLRGVLGTRFDIAPAEVTLRDRPDAPPRVTDQPGLHIGLAHARGVVAVALSDDGPVGIDVETARYRSRPVPAAATHPAKLAAARAVVGAELAPLGAWVAQEAALKLATIGLGLPFADVVVAPGAPGVRVRVGDRGTTGVVVRALPGEVVVGVATWDAPPALTWHGWGREQQPTPGRSTGGV